MPLKLKWTSRRHPRRGAALAFAILFSPAAFAQAAPDAGALSRQNQREHEPLLPGKSGPASTQEAPASPAPGNATLTVRAFRFDGNTLLGDAQLAPAVARFVGRPVDFAQLQQAAAAVAALYRDAGWIVRSYLPQQQVVGGLVTIRIVEARFGTPQVSVDDARRVSAARLVRIVQAQVPTGKPVQAAALDRAILLVRDLPGIEAQASLRAGANDRDTDLVLKVSDRPPAEGRIAVDNAGPRATGAARVLAHLGLESPSGHSERINADAALSSGSRYLWLDASMPAGSQGWRLGLAAWELNYRLGTPEFAALDAHGSAGDLGARASYPVVRARSRNLYLNLGADHKRFDNRSAGTTSSRYRSDALTLGLAGNRFDDWAGGGATNAQATLVAGRLDLAGSPNQAADAATARTAGAYTKLQLSLSRLQTISETLSAYAALSLQAASKNLDSSEMFYLGGAQGVRAYPVNEGSGSGGELLNLELRRVLPAGFALTGFIDWGCVRVHVDAGFAGATAPNRYCLKGGGATLAWQAGPGTGIGLTWAHRLGHNPSPGANGADQDGSRLLNRFWLTASLAF
ncbi:MAG: ShlB/FhaC/HecB family hemolysin secretion/activation protein [Burkholderiales bacterium]|nr:ShlB/FhaC/HecB family hemolysin secretion/activation protein [Burkholderiales bacterium]